MGRDQPLRTVGAFFLRFIPFVIAFAAAPAWLFWSNVSEREADKQAWTISGPPCPAMSERAQGPSQGPDLKQRITYGGATFSYRSARAYCAEQARNSAWPSERYVVCQFNNPGAVAVSAGGSRAAFRIPPGERATVTADRKAIRCVVGGWFRL
jgi:hypothetical protein